MAGVILTGVASSVSFTQGAAAALLFGDVTLGGDAFAGGALQVTGLLPEDIVSVADGGTGAGQIGLSGASVTYGGLEIGTLGGGAGTDLRIDLQAGADPVAVEALIESLTYANPDATPTEARTFRLHLTDGTGGGVGEGAFTQLIDAANPFSTVDVGSASTPSFVDLDGDGDLDAVFGESYGRLRAFLNTGAGFAEMLGAANPFDGVDVGSYSAPTFVDVDGDGHLDAVFGEGYGTLRTYANNGAGAFTQLVGAANPLKTVNTGSSATPAFADFDGDGEVDVVVGDRYGTLRAYANDGAGGFAALSGAANPFNGIDVGRYSAPAFVDFDGDGDLDLVVGETYGSLRAYANEGAWSFTPLIGAANPFNGINVDSVAAPSFADIDGDGDFDVVVGRFDGTLRVFEQTQTGLAVEVSIVAGNVPPVLTGAPEAMSLAENSGPALLFGDVGLTDAEGFAGGALRITGLLAEDVMSVADGGTGVGAIGLSGADVTYGGAIIGTLSGGAGAALRIDLGAGVDAAAVEALIESLTFANASDAPTAERVLRLHLTDDEGATLSPAAFTALTGAANPFDAADVGDGGAPAFADIDGDGDLDAVVGANDGALHAFVNNGAAGFSALTPAANPFFAIDMGSAAAPGFVDLDGDGHLDAVIGAGDGALRAFANDGAGEFAELTGAANPFNGVAVGADSAPAFADIDGDGNADALIGAQDGTLHAFANDGAGGFSALIGAANPFNGIDVGSAASPAFVDLDGDGDLDAVIGAGDGTLRAFANDGAGAFAELIAMANPFNGIDVGSAAAPVFADLDGDGDLDALIGAFDGTLRGFAHAPAGVAIAVSVVAVNDAPTARDDTFAMAADSPLGGSVLVDNGAGADDDVEGDALSIAAVNGVQGAVGAQITLASGALLTLNADGAYLYDPTLAFATLKDGDAALDSFTYTLSDGQGGEDVATVQIAIAGISDAPVARLDMFVGDEDGAIIGSVLADNGFGADGDLDGDALTVVRMNNAAASVEQTVALPSGALLTLNADGTFDYDPNGAFDWLPEGANMSDGFSYSVSDGQSFAGASAVITLIGVNDAPVFMSPAAFSVAPGDTAVGMVGATDAEGDALTYAITGGADADMFAIDQATGALSFLALPVGGAYDVTVAAFDGAATTEQAVGVSVPPTGAAIGEVVQLTVGTSWQTLSFANDYVDPVVFALAPTLNEVDAAATRFRNVTGTGAEIRLQEPKKIIDPETGLQISNATGHIDETVTLLVMEKGIHTLEGGAIIQVGEINTNKLYVKGFEDVAFAQDFDTTPSIFSQVQSFTGTDYIISRQRNPDGTGFQLTMQEEEADNRNHSAEDVGWMAIEHGSGSLLTMDWQVGSSAQNVNGKLTNVNFSAAFDTAPLVVASLASYNGTDTSSPRIGTVTETKFTAMALEDTSDDLETNHGYEIVDWMAFSQSGTIHAAVPELVQSVAAPGRLVAASGVAEASGTVITVSFGAQFEHPVVIASLSSMADGAAAIARMSNVTEAGFDLILQTPDGAAHAAEAVSWMVVEAGSWQLTDGTMLQAGLTDLGATTRQGFAAVGFNAAFTDGPAVLSQVQTMNDAAFVKTRMQGVDGAGFEVALEEAEAASWGSHGNETVGWIAADMGLAADADGFVFEAGELSTNHQFADAGFEGAFDGAPGVLAGLATFNAPDTAAARVAGVTDAGFEVKVEEDMTRDAETAHGVESVHWIAFDQGEIWGDAIG